MHTGKTNPAFHLRRFALLPAALCFALSGLVAAPTPSPSPAPAASASPAPSAAPELITDFAYSGANNDAEVAHNAQKGAKVYKDNDAALGDLPAYLAGADYIRPFLADAGEGSSTDQYQFDVTQKCYVYLLIDSANDMPDNNDNETYKWQKLPETVKLNGRTMVIYKSRLMQAKDNVYLATNGHGAKKFDPKSNMYLVLVKAAQ